MEDCCFSIFFKAKIYSEAKSTTFARKRNSAIVSAFIVHHSLLDKMTFPSNCKYTEDHEWIRLDSGNTAYVGITDFAQGELGELVYIEVETVGETVEAHGLFGTVEAVKTTSDLFMPITAKVLEFNAEVGDSGNPALVNEDPYGKGWIVKIEVQDLADVAALMDADAYQKHIGK